MREELAAFNAAREQAARAKGQDNAQAMMGIGLNAGSCTVGNMGSLRRFDYSVLGDTVNLAARLERVSKFYHVDILVAESVVQRAPQFAWLELDWIRVKGRSEVTTIFALAGDAAFAQTSAFSEWRRVHAEMLSAYRTGDLAGAQAQAHKLSGQVPPSWCALYQSMAERFAEGAALQEEPGPPAVRVLDSL
jgi:adenylate cyclase